MLPVSALMWITLQGQAPGAAFEKNNAPMHTRALVNPAGENPDNGGASGAVRFNNRDLGPEGSMYLSDGFIEGTVLLADNTVLSELQLRYNVYFEQMQFIRGEDTMAFARPDEISHILMDNKKFIYCEFLNDGVIDSSYFTVLADGDCCLLQRNIVKYHRVPGEQNDACEKDTFYKSCDLYLKKGDYPAVKTRCSRKSILRSLADRGQEIKAFMKKEGLKIKTAEEMARVVDHYNSLN